MERVLVNSDEFCGQYVALKSATDNAIVGSGPTPQDALREAAAKGIQKPYLLYVPDKGMVHIYHAG